MSATTMNGVAKVQVANNHDISASSIQQPGELIRPIVANGTVEEVVKRKYGMTALRIKELNSYNDRNYFLTVDDKHSNKAVTHLHPYGYVLKISNIKDSQDHYYFEAQHLLIPYLNKGGIPTQTIVPNLSGDTYSLEEMYADKDGEGVPCKYAVELRTFIPGKIIRDVRYTPALLKQDGHFVAKISLALKGFHHSFYAAREILWSITSVPTLGNYTFCLEDDDDRRLMEEVVAAFNKEVVSAYDMIPKGYIHGDPNEQNIIVSQDSTSGLYNVCGIIDYTDASNSYPILDLAINIAYLMIDSDVVDKLDTPGYILAGYVSARELTELEWAVLPYCVAGRLAQTLTLGAHASFMEPDNEYILTTAAKGWPLFRRYWSHPMTDLVCRWRNIIKSISVTGDDGVGGGLHI